MKDTNSVARKANRLSILLQNLLATRIALCQQFPIPFVTSAAQLVPEEGMVLYYVDESHPQFDRATSGLLTNALITIPLLSNYAAPTENEEPILVSFLLHGFGTRVPAYRTVDSLYTEGYTKELERITIMGTAVNWSRFSEEDLDQLIWYVDKEVSEWSSHLTIGEDRRPTPEMLKPYERVRELAVALEKLWHLNGENPFISVVDQTAQVFLEKINKQIEREQEKQRGDQA